MSLKPYVGESSTICYTMGKMLKFLSVIYFSLILHVTSEGNGHGYDIRDEIDNLAKRGLGLEKFERHLESVETTTVAIGETMARDLANELSYKLQLLDNLLHDMISDVEMAYDQMSSTAEWGQPNCRDVTGTTTLLLGDNVDIDTWCLTGDPLDNQNIVKTYLRKDSLVSSWKNKYMDHEGIKYIKFADQNGVLYNYPAKPRLDDNAPYDARFSQWYVETATPDQKDIIIMIDKSRSMKSNDGLTIARQAVFTVVDTLNLNDRIGIIVFGEDIDTLDGENGKHCYSKQLAKATDVNKENLIEFVKNIDANSDNTRYIQAISTAFGMFRNTPDDTVYVREKREKVILIFTDGETSEDADSVCNTIKQENRGFNNSVLIITFGVGTDVQNEDLLATMAEQTCIEGADIPRKEYTPISSIDNLRQAMSSYYSYFTQVSTSVKYSVPYKDIFNTGTQISMCLQVYGVDLNGVFCIDIALEYLLNDITYFRNDDGAYAFMIDQNSRVLSHPLLPNTAQIAADYFFVYLPNVEIADDIEEIQIQMARDDSGRIDTNTLRIIPQGSGGGQNVLTRKEPTTYYFHHVGTGNRKTPFSVGIVTIKAEQRVITWNSPRSDVWFHLDHFKEEKVDELCGSFVRITAKDRAAVAISPRCMADPYNYVYFNKPTQEEINQFLDDNSVENPRLKDGVRDAVSALHQLETIWKVADHSENIIWRYFGLRNGIVITFPGLQIPRLYDVTIRPWFLGAMAEPDKFYITPPYIDVWGAGVVISVVKATRTINTETVGVIAMDLTIASFYYTATSLISDCIDYECIIINDKGFIIVHKDWIEEASESVGKNDIHIAQEESHIAERLIQKDILQAKSCIDIARDFKQSVYWQIDDTLFSEDINIDEKFTISIIPDTNLYLIVKRSVYDTLAKCICSQISCPTEECHCPCFAETEAYEYCIASLNTTSSPPCSPKVASQDASEMLRLERERLNTLNLPDCRDYRCPIQQNKRDCSGVLSCSWCTHSSSNQLLDAPYCSTVTECPYGKEGVKAPVSSSTTDGASSGTTDAGKTKTDPSNGGISTAVIVIIVLIMLILLGIAAVLIVIYLVRRNSIGKLKSDSEPEYNLSTQEQQHASNNTYTGDQTAPNPAGHINASQPPRLGPPPPRPDRPPQTNTLPGFGMNEMAMDISPHAYQNGDFNDGRGSTVSYDKIPQIRLHAGVQGERLSDAYLRPKDATTATVLDDNYLHFGAVDKIPVQTSMGDISPRNNTNILIAPPRVDEDPDDDF